MPGFSLSDARGGCAAAVLVNRQARQDHDAGILPVIHALRAQGLSLTEIGGELMTRGYPPRRGSYWHKKQLLRVLAKSKQRDGAVSPAAEEAIESVTIPTDGAFESATLPAEAANESVTIPVIETAESVTIPVDVHHHGVHQEVT
jgi:hypothetical protein